MTQLHEDSADEMRAPASRFSMKVVLEIAAMIGVIALLCFFP